MANIERKVYQTHPYHLVDLSPWPLLTSTSVFTMVLSLVLWMHGFVNGSTFLILGFMLTTASMILWFRDIIAEGTIN